MKGDKKGEYQYSDIVPGGMFLNEDAKGTERRGYDVVLVGRITKITQPLFLGYFTVPCMDESDLGFFSRINEKMWGYHNHLYVPPEKNLEESIRFLETARKKAQYAKTERICEKNRPADDEKYFCIMLKEADVTLDKAIEMIEETLTELKRGK